MDIESYNHVAELIQAGKADEARSYALAIENEHIRAMALILIERSQRIHV